MQPIHALNVASVQEMFEFSAILAFLASRHIVGELRTEIECDHGRAFQLILVLIRLLHTGARD